jgi:hypothetical protein
MEAPAVGAERGVVLRFANGGILPGTRTGEEDEGISDMLGSVPVR